MPRAMLLCAGAGTRLWPLTRELPKPLLPFGDRPLVEHAFGVLDAARLGPELVLNVHHGSEQFFRWSRGLSRKLHLIHEPELRGTAGGIAGALPVLGPAPVVVMLGDVILERVPGDLLDAAEGRRLILMLAPRPAGAGNVGVGEGDRVVRLRGERFGIETAGGEYVGLCALGARGLDELPARGCLVGDYALPLLRRGEAVHARWFSGEYRFPGDRHADYLRENLDWLEATMPGRSFVGKGAQVAEGVSLEQSIVGAGARVTGEGSLVRTLVWPEATARAPLSDAIVTPASVLKIPIM